MKRLTPLERRIKEYERDPEYQLELFLLDTNGKIAHFMEHQAISRAKLARNLGTSRAYVTQLLSGRRNLTLKSLIRISMALGADLDIDLRPRGCPLTAEGMAWQSEAFTDRIDLPLAPETDLAATTSFGAQKLDGNADQDALYLAA